MKKCLLLCLFSITSILLAYSQSNNQFKRFFPLRMGNNPVIEAEVEILQTYRINSNELIIVAQSSEEQSRLMYLVKDDDNKFQIKFESNSPYETTTLLLDFFRAADGDLIIICSDGSEQLSWGQGVYTLQNGTVQHMGALNIGVSDREHYHSIASAISIKRNEQEVMFHIDGNFSLAAIDSSSTERVSKSAVQYLFDGKKLHLVE